MKKTLRCRWLLLVLGILTLLRSPESRAAVEALESPVLRVEITTSPCSFCVIEKSTGEHLTSQSGTAFTFGSEFYPVLDATNFVKGPDSVQADLLLELAGRDILPSGMPHKAHVTFRFLDPQVWQVRLAHDRATEISEEFDDQGEHYYGIWECPCGGNINNRGADHDFLGLGNQRYVHHSSVRAPFYVAAIDQIDVHPAIIVVVEKGATCSGGFRQVIFCRAGVHMTKSDPACAGRDFFKRRTRVAF